MVYSHIQTHTCTQCLLHLTQQLIFWHFRLIIWIFFFFWILKSWTTYWKLLFMFAQVFVRGWGGKPRCFHGDKGNVSGSPEFRPEMISRMKSQQFGQCHPIPVFTPNPSFPLSNLVFSLLLLSPSSSFPPLHPVNTSPFHLYLFLQMLSLWSSIILHKAK